MLRDFSSVCIACVLVFLLQQKSWRDERELVTRYLTEDIRVGIRGVSWISFSEQGTWQTRGCARGTCPQHHPSTRGQTETSDLGVHDGAQTSTTPLLTTRTDRDSWAAKSEVIDGEKVKKPSPPAQVQTEKAGWQAAELKLRKGDRQIRKNSEGQSHGSGA